VNLIFNIRSKIFNLFRSSRSRRAVYRSPLYFRCDERRTH